MGKQVLDKITWGMLAFVSFVYVTAVLRLILT